MTSCCKSVHPGGVTIFSPLQMKKICIANLIIELIIRSLSGGCLFSFFKDTILIPNSGKIQFFKLRSS